MAFMSNSESYAERRQLFRDIWNTALQMDCNDPHSMNKPKVIKTLCLDEVDNYSIGKRRKERIKNLRQVCRKILDFCDRQDAEDDMLYERIIQEKLAKITSANKGYANKSRKLINQGKRKFKNVKPSISPMAFESKHVDTPTDEDSNLKDVLQVIPYEEKNNIVARPKKRIVTTMKPLFVNSPLKRNLSSKTKAKTSITYRDTNVLRRKLLTNQKKYRKKSNVY